MAVIYPSKLAHLSLHTSPTLPHSEFDTTHPVFLPLRAPHSHSHSHTAKYITALETEHSRDLYLQGAMVVGQIARLLEELCADIYKGDGGDGDDEKDNDENDDDDDDGEEKVAAVELSTRPIHQFVSHEKRDQIAAWARAVTPLKEINRAQDQQSPCDADVIDLEDADATYLRGAFIVGDIADLLDDLVRGLDDEKNGPLREGDCERNSAAAFSPEQVALAQLPAELSQGDLETPESDFASRLNCLSARLAKLEMDINVFSQDRSDALKQMELDDTSVVAPAQDWDKELEHWSGCCEAAERVGNHVHEECPADVLGICDTVESENGLLISRVWTMTDTTTSGFSLVTPSESEVQPVIRGSVKDYFWSSD